MRHPTDGRVSLRDGVRVDLSTGETVVMDAEDPAGDTAVLSHAHGDHLYARAPGGVVCSELTADLAAARRPDEGPLDRASPPNVTQVPAGHVPGSRATVVEDGETTYLYTGDLSTRDRFTLDGFDPVAVAAEWNVDALVVETTYGTPEYVFDEQAELEARIVDWLDDAYDAPVLLFGYTLGRAQELEELVARSERDRLFVTEAIQRIDDVIESHTDVRFDAARYGSDVTLGAGDAVVLPAQTNGLSFVDRIVEGTGAIRVGFSGWAIEESFRYRGGYDETFVLSDHCDFSELVDVVETIGPDRVYTQHGFADEFATHVETELGIGARSLKRNQTSLGDF